MPQHMMIGFGDGMERFFACLVVEIENLPSGHDRRGKTFADLHAPDDARIGGQGGRYPRGRGRVAVTPGSAPLRPIFRRQPFKGKRQ